LVDDVLAEAVYDDMDNAEQMEFPEVAHTFKQRRARRAVAEWRLLKAQGDAKMRKKRAQGKSKAKARSSSSAGAPKKRARRAGPAEMPDVGPEERPGVVEPTDSGPEDWPEAVEPVPADAGAEGLALMPAGVEALAAPAPPAVDLVAERPLRPAAARDVPAAPRARPRVPAIEWTVIECNVCHAEAGQIKMELLPGGRDGPTWHMRVSDPATQRWAVSGPRYRTRRTTVIGDSPDFATDWVQTNRECCKAAAA
jgi:hypothetical protein